MTTMLKEVGAYQAAFRDLSTINGAFAALREAGFSRFAEVGMPTARRGNERWKYTNVAPIARAEFTRAGATAEGDAGVTVEAIESVAPWSEDWETLVFVNGRHVPDLSSTPGKTGDGLEVSTLAAAAVDHPDIVDRYLGRYAPVSSDDGFGALNTAFLTDGAFVRITGEVSPDRPVHLLFFTTDLDEPTVAYPRVLVLAEANSVATVIETYAGTSSSAYFTNAVSEIVLEDGARLTHYRVMNEGTQAFHIGTTRISQGGDTSLTAISFAFGARLGRNDMHVLLDAPGAECVLNGLYMTSGSQHLDNHISLTHAKPHATSRQLYKGILTGESRAVFSGQVLVEQDAQKTYAVQRDMNLLLSDRAEVDTKPSLIIYADDVQCFHGAAAGEVDEDAVFYMMSRGIDKETASNMLISAYASEIVDQVETAALRDHLTQTVTDLLPVFKI
ncbi:MAG: Fe-S cluster assembly protein SufD [Chloroflexi bacterium]|nr:Fe-S cluster assembly protein SufD [Chloroflexota bacterium]